MGYSGIGAGTVARFSVSSECIEESRLDSGGLARWVDGADPMTGERRGREPVSYTHLDVYKRQV